MEPVNYEFLQHFEQHLETELLKLCTEEGMLSGTLLKSDDIDERWRQLAPEYMVDAVPQVAHYPTVSVAWTAYLGAAVAQEWDCDWEALKNKPYKDYYGKAGFDDMDENIIENILGLKTDSEQAKKFEDMIRKCGELSVIMIRREGIEPQSVMAFHVFARACKAMFRIGAALELKRLGYKFEKVNLN